MCFPEVMNICLPQGNPIQPVRTVFGKSASDAGRRRFLTELVRTMVLFLFFDSRTNQFLDFTGGLLETLFPMSSEHFYDMAVLEQEVNLRVSRYIAHNLIYKIQEGAAKYGREEFDEGEIREQAYVCYMTGACGRLHVPARAFDMEQFCRMDGKLSRTGEGPFVEAYARLMMLHLSEQFPSGEVARSFLEDRCRRDAGRQRNYDVICREYAKDSLWSRSWNI